MVWIRCVKTYLCLWYLWHLKNDIDTLLIIHLWKYYINHTVLNNQHFSPFFVLPCRWHWCTATLLTTCHKTEKFIQFNHSFCTLLYRRRYGRLCHHHLKKETKCSKLKMNLSDFFFSNCKYCSDFVSGNSVCYNNHVVKRKSYITAALICMMQAMCKVYFVCPLMC